MKKWSATIVITLAAIAAGVFLWWQMDYQQNTLSLSGQRYHLSIMDDEAERERGLSGTDNLPEGEAMLFVFPSDNTWGIWMKDMKYPIDIVWLDSDKKVVYTIKDAQPSSYPKIFQPVEKARYVIELPNGTIEKTGIAVGDPAGLPSGV